MRRLRGFDHVTIQRDGCFPPTHAARLRRKSDRRAPNRLRLALRTGVFAVFVGPGGLSLGRRPTPARLRLAALEVLPQRRPQPVVPRFAPLRLALVAHVRGEPRPRRSCNLRRDPARAAAGGQTHVGTLPLVEDEAMPLAPPPLEKGRRRPGPGREGRWGSMRGPRSDPHPAPQSAPTPPFSREGGPAAHALPCSSGGGRTSVRPMR